MSLPAPVADPERRLRRARLALLRQGTTGLVFAAALVLVICTVMWRFEPPSRLLSWAAGMLVLLGARAVHLRRHVATLDDRSDLTRVERWFVAGLAATGAGWGLAGFVLLPPDNLLYQSFLSFVLAGVTATAVVLYAPLLNAVRLYLACALLPLITAHLLLGGTSHLAMAAMVAAHAGIMLWLAGRAHAAVNDTLETHFRNDDLIAELTTAKRAAEAVNSRLSAEIGVHHETAGKLIEARDKAEQAARAKSDFLATMSHEIRTPMNGVLGMAELLLNTQLSGKQHRFASTIRRSGEALLAIINDILDFSKIEAGKLELQHTVFDLRQLVEDMAASFAEPALRKRIDLLSVVPPDAHAAYRGDPDRLRQVLFNLVGNAIKFTERGEVTVELRTCAQRGDQDELRFEVRDSGVGIAPDHLARVFESFEQGDSSTTRRFGGTGLGLSISKRLVELMHGTIGAESAPNQGSTFWFTVTLARMPASAISGQSDGAAELAGRRVLVIDDHATNRDVLKYQLRHWGMSYYGAADAQQGIKFLRQALRVGKPFDLAILDRRLPDLDGVELAKQIKKDPAIGATRLIMLSSVDQLEQTGEWLRAGIEVYVNKPVRQVELRDALTTALASAAPIATVGARATPARAAASGASPMSFGAHVLLAEDNPVNQELARAMLEALGCSVVLVEDGAQAFEALAESPLDRRQRPYDLVLMDCQMPVCDGYDATRRIRRWEQDNKARAPMPIVALTANALAGDRERCLAAGMNDYLGKPFSQAQLGAVIKRWLTVDVAVTALAKEDATTAAARVPALATSHDGVADLDRRTLDSIRSLTRDDGTNVLAKVVRMYLTNSPKMVEKLQEAASTGNANLLLSSAHSLKSASANLGALRLAGLCAELEQRGRDGVMNDVVPALGILEYEYEAVRNALGREIGIKAA